MAPRGGRNPFINFYLMVARKMRGKPVTAIARVAGSRWRAMSVTERLDWYRNCGAGSNWVAGLASSRSRCSSGLRSSRATAVSRSPFINFFVSMYKELGKDLPVSKVAVLAGKKWRCLSIPERRPFYEAACRFGHKRLPVRRSKRRSRR